MRALFRTRGRKAQLEIQFNWIFVLIVGAIILAFFITVINNQQKRASAEEATDLVNTLDTQFTAIKTNPNSLDNFSIANAEVEFDCEPELSQYRIQGAGPVPARYDAIFTPARLRGDTIITWTSTWEAPFEVTTLTNMASDRILFIFVRNGPAITDEDDDPVVQLYREMPGRYRKLLHPIDGLHDLDLRGYDRYVVITTAPPTGLEGELHIRMIAKTADLDKPGTITFNDGAGTEDRKYITRDTLWGAIFTEDADTYDCTMSKAVLRLKSIAAILEYRAEILKEEVDFLCQDFFWDAEELFSDLTILDSSYSNTVADTIIEKKKELERINALAWRGNACPYVY